MMSSDGYVQRKVWAVDKTGSLDGLALRSDGCALPSAGEVRVQVKCVGLNFADVFAVLGLYSATPPCPFVPGLEFSGLVDAIGDGETDLKVGDRVMGCTRFGGYASVLNVDRRCVRRLPKGWDFAQGASFLAQGLTAYYGLFELGQIQGRVLRKEGESKTKTVLLHSGAGGVGLIAIDLCQRVGAHVVVTVGSRKKVSLLKDRCNLSDRQIIVRTSARDFPRQLEFALEAFPCRPKGFDIVFDSLAGDYFQPGFDALLPGGKLILFGSGSLMPPGNLGIRDISNYYKLATGWLSRPRLDPVNMIPDNRTVSAFNLIWLWEMLDSMTELVDELLSWQLRSPFVGKQFHFDKAVDAMKFFQSGSSVGKVVLQVTADGNG